MLSYVSALFIGPYQCCGMLVHCETVSTNILECLCSFDRSVPMLWYVTVLLVCQYQYCGMLVHCGTVSTNFVGC